METDSLRQASALLFQLAAKFECSTCSNDEDNSLLLFLRYHGRWIFKKNTKNLFFAVQIEKTEKNNLQKEWRKKLFYFLR